ncbi:hypothetical protein K456DRAFT_1129870 [Colletotrichum gloeosporioides 23]|nr:hypothetical protein K456DRAFT_1129870 [Colletotrichum gloeosporioides 23]
MFLFFCATHAVKLFLHLRICIVISFCILDLVRVVSKLIYHLIFKFFTSVRKLRFSVRRMLPRL